MDPMSRPEDAMSAVSAQAAVVEADAAASSVPPLAFAAASSAAALDDDVTLMLRYRDQNDLHAFETLYQRHKGPLYRYLQRMCGNRETAGDLFQEVWGKVIAARGRYEALAQFKTFLFRVAHNCVVDHMRRANRTQDAVVPDADVLVQGLPDAAHERPEALLAEAQLRADFRRALDALPAQQRDVFLLYEETGLSLEEIGRVTGVAMETAKSRLRYALAKLRAALAQHRRPHPESSVQ
jgi:RNA polymerase sigma-70 factor (ECF subfamily)